MGERGVPEKVNSQLPHRIDSTGATFLHPENVLVVGGGDIQWNVGLGKLRHDTGVCPAMDVSMAIGKCERGRPIVIAGRIIHNFVAAAISGESRHVDDEITIIDAVLALIEKYECLSLIHI